MESIENKSGPGQSLIDGLYLLPGKRIKLAKVESEENLDNETGLVLDGVLDKEIRIGQPILINGNSEGSGIVSAVKHEAGRFFFRTDVGVYELKSSEEFKIPEQSKSEAYKKLEQKMEYLLDKAKAHAVDVVEMEKLLDKRFELENQVRTLEITKQIQEIDKEMDKFTVHADTIIEFKILMEKTGRIDYKVTGTVEHENAHSNVAGHFGFEERGYQLIVAKNQHGFVYQPVAESGRGSTELTRKEFLEAKIRVSDAPREYGNKNSPGDEESINDLRRKLREQE